MNKYKVLFKDTNAAGEMRAMDLDAGWFSQSGDMVDFCVRDSSGNLETVATFSKESICGVIKIFITE